MKKVGLALGGGTALGFSHIGVLESLEKNKIKIDYLSGTSMGAVIAALYASGMSIRDMKEITTTTRWENLVDFKLPDRGILSGDKIEKFLRVLLKNKQFKDLNIPLAVVATDIYNGEKIIFKKGDVASAVRASISLPNIFVPFEYNNRVLIDGGIVDPIPVDIAKSMGADIVIATDLSVPVKNVVINSKTKKNKKFLKKIEKKLIEQEINEINNYTNKHKDSIPWFLKGVTAVLNRPKTLIEYFTKHRLRIPEFLTITSNSFSIMTSELSRSALKSADYVIKPNLKGFTRFDFGRVEDLIKRGKTKTDSSIKDIKKLIK